MIKLNYATIVDSLLEEDVREYSFKTINKMIDFIDEQYHAKNKKCVFICMFGADVDDEMHEYYITSCYISVTTYFLLMSKEYPSHNRYWLFEETTFENAFLYCTSHSETHELGLN